MEAVECGAAALGIVLGYYGRVVPLAELRRECGVFRDGSSAANVLQAAQHYGLQATGFSMEVAALQALRGPTIVFWNFNHFVVVEGFYRQRVYINDPASGPRTVSLEEFSKAFTGVVLVMEPGPDFTQAASNQALYMPCGHGCAGLVARSPTRSWPVASWYSLACWDQC